MEFKLNLKHLKNKHLKRFYFDTFYIGIYFESSSNFIIHSSVLEKRNGSISFVNELIQISICYFQIKMIGILYTGKGKYALHARVFDY